MTEKRAIGKYEIVAELGRGGMGVVYKAWEESLKRHVAIKMLGDQLTQDEKIVERFLREARAVADLNHPNVVQVFAVDTYEGKPYFAMEYVEGESLTQLINSDQRVEPKRAAEIIKEAATGLAAAHAKDVVHRDIKPDNIMLTKHGGVKVVDFGIAKVDDPDSKLTATGMMVGTPNYISPEVCLGQEVDARSDIFSLGIVFFEMLAGQTPFQADSPIAMMTAVVEAEVPDITSLNPLVEHAVRQILSQMLQKNPARRYRNCQEIIEDLSAYLAGQPPAHAIAAADDATIPMRRPAVRADTLKAGVAAVPAQSAPPGTANLPARRTGQLGWVVGLLLIVGVAAGSWVYVDQPQSPVRSQVAETPVEVDLGRIDDQVDEQLDDGDSPRSIPASEDVPPKEVREITAELPTRPSAASSTLIDEPLAQSTTQIALVTPPPKQAKPTPVKAAGPPKLVVIARGDPAVSTVVEAVLEGALLDADFQVMDEQFFADLNLGAFNTDLAQVGQSVQANGADILIFADIRETGQRNLSFYGRSERQTLANMQVRAMLLADKRSLGAPWLQSLEYVPLNASDAAREAAMPIAEDLVARLQSLAE